MYLVVEVVPPTVFEILTKYEGAIAFTLDFVTRKIQMPE